ncbi:hypothetical protein FLSI110296_16175 [Flavobacterium sinopsychrotolerans]
MDKFHRQLQTALYTKKPNQIQDEDSSRKGDQLRRFPNTSESYKTKNPHQINDEDLIESETSSD